MTQLWTPSQFAFSYGSCKLWVTGFCVFKVMYDYVCMCRHTNALIADGRQPSAAANDSRKSELHVPRVTPGTALHIVSMYSANEHDRAVLNVGWRGHIDFQTPHTPSSSALGYRNCQILSTNINHRMHRSDGSPSIWRDS